MGQAPWDSTAIRNPQSAIRNPQSAIRNPQSAIRNPQSSIINHQSSIINHQSSIINHQSSIINLQSAICNLQSAICLLNRFVVQVAFGDHAEAAAGEHVQRAVDVVDHDGYGWSAMRTSYQWVSLNDIDFGLQQSHAYLQ